MFTKKTQSITGLQVLCSLAKLDNTIYGKILTDLGDILVRLMMGTDEKGSQSTAIALDCIEVMKLRVNRI
jgi:hypothetical protein